jgi:hypothetical protein
VTNKFVDVEKHESIKTKVGVNRAAIAAGLYNSLLIVDDNDKRSKGNIRQSKQLCRAYQSCFASALNAIQSQHERSAMFLSMSCESLQQKRDAMIRLVVDDICHD